MAGSIKQKNIHKDFRLIGVYSSYSNYLAGINKSSAAEGMCYYDTTLNQLRTYDGSDWSPAGLSSASPGSLDAVCQLGCIITNTQAIEIQASASTSNLFILDANGTTNVDILDISSAGGSGDLINLTQAGTGMDIRGTAGWTITNAGVGTFTTVTLGDAEPLNLGATPDAILQWDGTTLLLACAADSTLQIGDASYAYDVHFVGDSATTNSMIWDINGGENAKGSLLFNNADIHLGDNDRIQFGDTAHGDFAIDYNNADLLIVPTANNDGIIFGTTSAATDILIYGDTATSNLQWYSAGDRLVLLSAAGAYDTGLQLDDWVGLTFGAGASFATTGDGDWQMYCSGATNNPLTIIPTTDDSIVVVGNSGATKNADLKWYTGGTAGDGFFIDASTDLAYFTGVNLRFDDNSKILIGTSADGSAADAYLAYDGSANELDIACPGGEIRFHSDVTIGTATSDTENLTVTGNLSVTGTFSHEGAYAPGSLSLDDDEVLNFGAADDLSITWDATNLVIEPVADNTGAIIIGSTNCMDFKVCAATATNYVLVNADDSAADLDLYGFALRLTDGTTTFTLGPTASNALALDGNAHNKTLDIGKTANIDVVFHGVSANKDVEWNPSSDTMHFLDDTILAFGGAADGTPDITITYDSANDDLLIDGAAANKLIRIGATNAQDFHVDGNAADMVWGASEDMLLFHDNAYIGLGLGSDLKMGGSGTTATFTIAAASTLVIADTNHASSRVTFGTNSANGLDLYINTITSGEDIIFDASAKTLTFDAVDIVLSDNDILAFGDASDITVTWTSASTALSVEAKVEDTGVVQFGKSNAMDVVWYSKTATKLATFNAGSAKLILDDMELDIGDNDVLEFGDSQDIKIQWESAKTALQIEAATEDTGKIQFGKSNAVDTVFYSKSAAKLITFDISVAKLVIDDWEVDIGDNDLIEFGDGQDITVQWQSAKTALVVEAANQGTGAIWFGKSNAVDVIFYGHTATDIVTFDVSEADVVLNGYNLQLFDNNMIELGTSQDIVIGWTSAKTALTIEAANQGTGAIWFGKTNAVDVVFHGHTATDTITFDVSAGEFILDAVDLIMNDADLIKFGDSGADGTLSSDGTNVNFVITAALDFGGTTNYTSVSSAGVITTFGSAKLDLISTTPIILEGATANTNQYTITVVDPTAAQVVTIPDTTGTIPVNSATTHDYGAATANWAMTATEAGASYFTVTNAGGAANATFPACVPGKIFGVYNGSGQAITFLVSGQAGTSITNAKKVVCAMNATDVVEIAAEV